MQFVLNLCAFDQFAKPRPLCFRGGCEIEHDGDPFRQENANVWRECVLQSYGMSVISPGNKAVTKSSCTSRTAFSRSANSLASVDLPAAIFPQRKINFAEPAIWPHIIALVTRAVDEIRRGC